MTLKPLNIWNLHSFVVFVAITIVFAVYIHRRYSFVAALTTAYFFLSGIILVYGPWTYYGQFQRQINDPSKSAMFSGALCVGLVTLLREDHFKKLFSVVKDLIVINTVALWFFPCGVFNAGSMDLTVSTMALPFFINDYIKTNDRLSLLKILVIVGTFIFWGSTTPFIAVAVIIAAWAFAIRKQIVNFRYYVYGILLSFVVGFASAGDYFFNMGNRVPVWIKVMERFYENFNLFVGTGTGSYRWLGPVMQGERVEVLLFMHNEWLQIIFENGIIGLMLVLSLMALCLRNVYKIPHLFTAMIVMLVICWAQFPLRIELGFIYCLCLVRICISKQETLA